jgi:CheY-like chemotaxis protein/phosphoribosyl 1,2-cyclic phosphodiesterase
VEAPDGTLVVLDCGTGAHELGQHLLGSVRTVRGHLLLTHTHWDHIQGFPFFAPVFAPGCEWDVYAPQGVGHRIEGTLAGQMEYAYFPVTLGQLGARIRYHDLVEGAFDVGSIRVTARYMNHPGLALGYRLEVGGVVMVYATDHEPHSPHQSQPDETGGQARPAPVHREDQRHVEFLAGADLVIHDSQYTLAEYPAKRGWGHSPAELVADFACAAGARRLALYHHDPCRTDDALDDLVRSCRERVAAGGGMLDIFAAAEGQVIVLEPERAAAPSRTTGESLRGVTVPGALPAGATLLLVDDDPDIIRLLTLTLRDEGFRLLTAHSGEAALGLARAERPDLILLDRVMPGCDGLDVCRALRAEADPRLRAVPIVLLTGQVAAEETAEGFAAGADDYVTKPFKPTHVRSRVHAWLVRGRAGPGAGP